MKKIIYFISILVAAAACTPPEVGYLSEDIHALEDTVFVPRGVFMTSAAPAAEGSTYPLHWEITKVRDASGNPVEDLFDKHKIITWKSAFNPFTDTTLALALAKVEETDQPSLLINDVSGEMAFTQATKYVTDNDIYNIDVKVSNVRGELRLDDFVAVKLMPFQPVEFLVEMRSMIQLGKGGGAYDVGYTSRILNNNDAGVPSVLDGTHPYISIRKTSDEPTLGFKARMVITDSYDTPIGPEKVVFYPSGTTFLQNFHDNSVETVNDATGTTFSLPAPPFPQYGRTYTGLNSYLMYYLTTADAFDVDIEKWEADLGPKNWTIYLDPVTGKVRCRGYIRWGIKINDTGTWELKMRIPYTIAK